MLDTNNCFSCKGRIESVFLIRVNKKDEAICNECANKMRKDGLVVWCCQNGRYLKRTDKVKYGYCAE